MKKSIGIAVAAAAIVALALAVRSWGFGLKRVTGTSMTDTLQSGDIVFMTRFDFLFGATPSRGDVVLCRFPLRRDDYIKRVVGLPGEHVCLDGRETYIDGRKISEPYVSGDADDFEYDLGGDQYLMLGDNRTESYDSRMPDMGPIHLSDMKGRIRMIVWPVSRIGRLK